MPANYYHIIFCRNKKYRPVSTTVVVHDENPVKIFLTMPKNKTNDAMLIKEMKMINNLKWMSSLVFEVRNEKFSISLTIIFGVHRLIVVLVIS